MQHFKPFVLSIIFIITTITLSAQLLNFEWVIGFGDNGSDQARDVTLDATGNIYTVGVFENTVDFDPGPGVTNLTSTGGNTDVFIQKLDPNGNFLWVKQFGDQARDITIDASGNIYVTGYYFNTVDFDPGPGVTNLTSNGVSDAFVVKLDPNGNFLWAKNIGGTGPDKGIALNIDPSGNVYLSGTYRSTVDFNPGAGTFNLTSNGQDDLFILKLDPSGNFLWAASMGEWGSDECTDIETDAAGNLYAVGHFYATVDFDPGPGTVNLSSNMGPADIFILKLDPNGNFEWVKQIGGINSDFVESIEIDAAGNIYTTGNFEEDVDFDPGPGVFNLTSAQGDDMFIHKMDANGDFVWVKHIAGMAGDESGESMVLDDLGNIYITGEFESIIDFNPGSGTFHLDAGPTLVEDIYILKLDANGDFVWAQQLGGASDDEAESIVIDANYNLYTVGFFLSTPADFDPGPGTTNLSPVGAYDVFIHKMSQCNPTPPTPDVSNLPDLTGECSVTAPTSPTATSNCFGSITGTTNTLFPITTQGTTVVTWSYDDGHGNILTQNQNVIINDVTDPVPNVSSLPSLNGQCSVTPTPPKALDNCDGLITGSTTSNFPITNQGTTTITWTFEDGSGNSVTQNQDVIINDLTNPTASPPPSISVCPGNIPPPDATVITDEADNCSQPTVSFVSDTPSSNSCSETITRTYAITDAAGNSINVNQFILVEDHTNPVPNITSLPNENYNCEANPSPPTAIDNCSGTINGVPNVTLPITSQGITNITWTYTDNCGNISTQTQEITVDYIDKSVSLDGATLSANASGYQYQWLDCNNNTPIAGETDQSFTPNSNGSYAVVLSGTNCSDTSLCYDINGVGIKENNTNNISMYPNPASDWILIDLKSIYDGNSQITILNTYGQAVFQDQMKGNIKKIKINHLPAGVYLVTIKNNELYSLLKLVKD